MCKRGRCLSALSDTREFSSVLLMAPIISKVTNAINVESRLVNYPTGSAVVAQPLFNPHNRSPRKQSFNHHAALHRDTQCSDRPIYRLRVWTLGRCEARPSTWLSNARPTGLGDDENGQKHVFALCAEVDKYPRQLQVLQVCHPALAEGGCGERIGPRPPAEHVSEHPANRWVQQIDLLRWFNLLTDAWWRPSLNFAGWKVF